MGNFITRDKNVSLSNLSRNRTFYLSKKLDAHKSDNEIQTSAKT